MSDPEAESKAEFSFSTAPPCPSFFFPYDPKQQIKQIKQIKEKDEQDEQDNAPQSS